MPLAESTLSKSTPPTSAALPVLPCRTSTIERDGARASRERAASDEVFDMALCKIEVL